MKYTPRGGRVDIEASARAETTSPFGFATPASGFPSRTCREYVGIGPFAAIRVEPTRGLGLGLSLVRASVEAQGGAVSVESPPGKGSTFSLRLPVTT